METIFLGLFLIVALILIMIAIPIVIYNGFVSGRQKVKEAFSGVYVQMRRRADLIPNLIETVKAYAAHEKGVLERVTELRSAFLSADRNNPKAVMAQEGLLAQALKSVFAVAENYPDLKASKNFLDLQDSLEEAEDQIAAARRIYNANVEDYNTRVLQFPSNIVARWFGFSEEPFFEADRSVDQVPRVSFT